MFERLAAIDIGSTAIRVVTAKKGLRNFEIQSFGTEPLEVNQENVSPIAKDVLPGIIEKYNLSNCIILSNLPMEKSIIRNITFPFSEIEKIAEAIPFEAEENLPFNLSDMSMDFQVLNILENKETRVLMAATHMDTLTEYLSIFHGNGLLPSSIGLESNSLFECYVQFQNLDDRNLVQIDIGHNKTIMNIIMNGNLVYTRSISYGIGMVIKELADIKKLKYSEAVSQFEQLRLDITSLDSNLERDFYKKLGLTKPMMKKLYDRAVEVLNEIASQINLTIKSYFMESVAAEIKRILISGGGANILGIGSHLAHLTSIPVSSLELPTEFRDKNSDSRFHIALGLLLANVKRKKTVNFLTGDLIPDFARSSLTKYNLAVFFAGTGVFLLILNFIFSAIITASQNSKYNEELKKQFQRLFHKQLTTEDPIKEAEKILAQEQKDFQSLKSILPPDMTNIAILDEILKFFPKDSSFMLKGISINEKDVSIEGEIGDSAAIDKFKNDLNGSKKFDSVNLSTNISGKTGTKFTMTIKLKNTKGGQK